MPGFGKVATRTSIAMEENDNNRSSTSGNSRDDAKYVQNTQELLLTMSMGIDA